MTNQFFDCMVDTETLGLPPTGALVAIGAVWFDLRTCTLGPTFSRTINLVSSVAGGGTMSAGTVLWWLRQGDEARKAVAYGGEPLEVVLHDFSVWIKETCRVEDVRPWFNSPVFDGAIVSGAYKRAGIPQPWRWSNERDFRTVRALNPQVEYDTDKKGSGAHNALADAIFQAEHLFAVKRSKQRA